MILTELDKAIFFPDVSLTGPALSGAILRAKTLAESHRGANRALEIRPYRCWQKIKDNSVFLNFLPMVQITEFKARLGSGRDTWGRSYSSLNWEDVEPNEYEFLEQTGQIYFLDDTINRYSEVRISYTAGFSFDEPLSAEAEVIKSVIGHILDYQTSGPGQGFKRLGGERDVEFQPSNPGIVPDDILAPLHQFRPRGI